MNWQLLKALSSISRSFRSCILPRMAAKDKGRKRSLGFSIDALLGPQPTKMAVLSHHEQVVVVGQSLSCAELRLEDSALWRRFNAIGTEMIVTRSGRRMFPTLQCSLHGLQPEQRCADKTLNELIILFFSHLSSYSLMVDFQCSDRKRYRYSFHQSKWIVAGPGCCH